MKKNKPKKAFTLIELIIVLSIIAIITSYALSRYNQSIVKTRRIDGKTALVNLANELEKYYLQNQTYAGATIARNPATDILGSEYSPQRYYRLAIIQLKPHRFTIEAIPLGSQAKLDRKCNHFRLNSVGEKFVTGSGSIKDCW